MYGCAGEPTARFALFGWRCCALCSMRRRCPLNLAILYDIGESISRNRQLEYMAYHDSLTGLPNRLLLLDRLHLTCSIIQRQQQMAALLFINLDRFRIELVLENWAGY